MSKKYFNVGEVYDQFLLLEEKYNLIYLECDGVKIWQILRYELFFMITEKIFNLGTPHVTNNNWNIIKRLPVMVWNALFNSGWFVGKREVLVFPHSRVQLVDNEYFDIYTKYFVDEQMEGGSDLLVLEKPYLQKHYSRKNDFTRYLDDAVLFSAIYSKLLVINFVKTESLVEMIQNEIKLNFEVEINLREIFKQRIKKYKSYYIYYTKLFRKFDVKRIYIVVAYSEPWLIRAAKDLNIKIVELQHGAFSKYHLGYSYNKKYQLDFLPDEFFVWNQYWKDLVCFPIDYDNIKIRHFDFQKKQIEKYKDTEKVKNQVVVLSQGTVSNKIAKVILDNFKYFENKTIKYKLHPGEYQRFKSYPFLTELLKKDNVELIVYGDLYNLLATSEYQVGVYSTALYEGIEFGLKTILCDLPNMEFMHGLLELGKIEAVLDEFCEKD